MAFDKTAAARKWRLENPEAYKAKQKRYRENNAEKVKAEIAAWREKNREELLAKKRQYYQDNKQKIFESKRQYVIENKDLESARRHQSYLRNRDVVLEKSKVQGKKTYLDKKEWLRDYKSKLKCNRCSENHIATLQFHHRNPKEKDMSISKMRKYSIKSILKEIAKCEVLCANCHAKEHHNEN